MGKERMPTQCMSCRLLQLINSRSGLVLTAHKTDDKGIPDSICVVFAAEKNISKGVIKTCGVQLTPANG